MAVPFYEALAGLLLLYLLPGLAVTQAVFPEWRFRGPQAVERAVTTGALAVILSASLTIVVGFALTGLPSGFSAAWSNPVLEEILAAIALVAAIVAWRRGAYARTPPAAPTPEPGSKEVPGWPTIRTLEQLHREERRLRHALRAGGDAAASARTRSRLEEVRAQIEEVRTDRGRELAE